MSGDQRIEIIRHLTEEELDRLLRPADDPKLGQEQQEKLLEMLREDQP